MVDPDRARELAEAERFLRDRIEQMAWHDDTTNDALKVLLAEYDRRGAELAASRRIVEAATALVEHWDSGCFEAEYDDIRERLEDALAAAVRSDQPEVPGTEGEQADA